MKMVENVKLRQIIAKIDFLWICHQEDNVLENLTSGCHGNLFVKRMKPFLRGFSDLPTRTDLLIIYSFQGNSSLFQVIKLWQVEANDKNDQLSEWLRVLLFLLLLPLTSINLKCIC